MTVFVNAIMYYKVKEVFCRSIHEQNTMDYLKYLQVTIKVKDATSAVANVDDYTGSARLLAATTLRKIFQYLSKESP